METCGIYKIINKQNNKYYIGSSFNVEKRWYTHKTRLKNNNHPNKYLQAAWNKYGEQSFLFVIEKRSVSKDSLLAEEQIFLNNCDKKFVYNLTFEALGGGSDARKKDYLLLDNFGNVIKNFLGGKELTEYLGFSKQINYSNINKNKLFKKFYRIVTLDFYNENRDLILSWVKSDIKPIPEKPVLYRLYKNSQKDKEILIRSSKELKKYIFSPPYKIEHLFKTFNYFETRLAYHKNSGYYINKENYIPEPYYLKEKLDFF
jgi:predicted GIY-YIG superfamily endonuclease